MQEYRNQASKFIGTKVLEWLWKPNGLMTKKMVKQMKLDGYLS